MAKFKDVQPGDIFWERGHGFFGWIIRLGSRSPYAHNGIVVAVDHRAVYTVEAQPGGAAQLEKSGKTFTKMTRLWRDPQEQAAIVNKALELRGSPYAYGEIARIIGWGAWQQKWWFFGGAALAGVLGWWVVAITLLALITLSNLWRLEWDTPNVICSNLAAQCLLAARPLELSFPVDRIWPGKLGEDLEHYEWEQFLDCQRGHTTNLG